MFPLERAHRLASVGTPCQIQRSPIMHRQLEPLLPTGRKRATKTLRARRKFLRAFPDGFEDETYLDWERNYKWEAHLRWEAVLSKSLFSAFLMQGRYADIAAAAVRVESRTNLLFSFEKMALRDALRTPKSARLFATALWEFLHGPLSQEQRFAQWVEALAVLPHPKTRVLTWPLATVFGFIAQPRKHFFFKPTVTREAMKRYGLDFEYSSRPSWEVYSELLNNVRIVRRDIADLKPRDMIDMQSFLWVQGSEEYPD